MADLSPATAAILDAYWEAFNAPLEGAVHRPLAAALRAAADQMSCYQSKKFLYSIVDAMKLRAIAAELEGQ
jgi:hypothetical protein